MMRRQPLPNLTSCMYAHNFMHVCAQDKTVAAREQLANCMSRLLHTGCGETCYHLKETKFGRKVSTRFGPSKKEPNSVEKMSTRCWYILHKKSQMSGCLLKNQ